MKSDFYPYVADKGFNRLKATSLFVPFLRSEDGDNQYFEIQWDKYHRPSFTINFGESSGDINKEDNHDWIYSGRFQKNGLFKRWFTQYRFRLFGLFSIAGKHSPVSVVEEVKSNFCELEFWWERKQIGPHLDVWKKNA